MKRLLLIGALVVLVLSGWFIKNGEMPIFNSRIAPTREWSKILVGKWKYSSTRKEIKRKYVYSGEIEFRNDNTFNFWLTIKAHGWHQANHHYISEPSEVISGKINGVWAVGNTLDLHSTSCTLRIGYSRSDGYVDSSNCYGQREIQYGDIKGDDFIMETQQFTANRILFSLQDNSKEGNTMIKLVRLD